jgi:Protein of unknown function (DUF1236)
MTFVDNRRFVRLLTKHQRREDVGCYDGDYLPNGANMKVTVFPLVLLASLMPVAVQAQGTVRGAQEGAAQGEREGGPIGAVVGGAVGAVTGTIGGILGVDDRRHFHEYVVQQHHPSYRYNDLRVGAILPPDGVTYYDIPGEYHVQGYRYAYVNDHAVLVDPRTRQIVEIID